MKDHYFKNVFLQENRTLFSFSSHLSVEVVRVLNHSSLRILRPDTEVTSNFISDSWVAFETLRSATSSTISTFYKLALYGN